MCVELDADAWFGGVVDEMLVVEDVGRLKSSLVEVGRSMLYS